MTPISFALEILLDCDTIEKAHKAARKQIKLLEHSQSPTAARPIPAPIRPQISQAQRIFEEELAAGVAPTINIIPQQPSIPQGVVGGEINNGDGTKGKRKW